MSWCFAIVNGRLAEIFFEKTRNNVGLVGHAYVKKSDYTTKHERQCIEKDTSKFKLIYKKGVYKDLTTEKIYQIIRRPSD